MENWTDKAIKRRIDEVIEESYLLSLSEQNIRNYLRTFVHSCETVLNGNVSIHGDIRLTRVKISLLKSYLLMHESASYALARKGGAEPERDRIEYLVHNVIRIKKTIIRLLDTINPALSQKVWEENLKRTEAEAHRSLKSIRLKNLFIDAGYYLLLAMVIAVLVAAIQY
jgi:hypothetical protein